MTRHHHHRHYHHYNNCCCKTSALLVVILYNSCYNTVTTTTTFALAFVITTSSSTTGSTIHKQQPHYNLLYQHRHCHRQDLSLLLLLLFNQHKQQRKYSISTTTTITTTIGASINNSIIMSPHEEEEEEEDDVNDNISIIESLDRINENSIIFNVHEKHITSNDNNEHNDSTKLKNQQLNTNNDVKYNIHEENADNESDNESDESSDESELLFTIGMIADIQYAPIDDGYNFSRTNKRYYRNSLIATKYAIEQFQNYHTNTKHNNNDNQQQQNNEHRNKVSCIIQLGDIIDGKCVETAAAIAAVIENDKTIFETTTETPETTTTLTTSTGTYTNSGSYTALQDVITVLNLYTHGPIIHMYGNHCLYNMDRIAMKHILNIPFTSLDTTTSTKNKDNNILNEYKHIPNNTHNKIQKETTDTTTTDTTETLTTSDATATTTTTTTTEDTIPEASELVGCYSYLMYPGYRCIVIDTYDISIIGRETTTTQTEPVTTTIPSTTSASTKYELANDILWKENTINMKNNNSNSPNGLIGVQKRFVGFNGGISTEQLLWLQNILQYCSTHNEYCIIVSHIPIHPLSVKDCPICLIWNYNTVLELFTQYSNCIVACFSGHAHMGGYYYDPITNIHYRIIEAILENIQPSYCIIQFYKNNTTGTSSNKLVVNGYGNCESGVYKY